MKFIFCVPVLAMAVGLYSCNDTTPKAVKETKVSTADSAEIALQNLNDRLRANPKQPELYLERSKIQQIKGNFQAAYIDAIQAIALDSLSPDNWYELGKVAFLSDNLYRAEEAYRRCLMLDKRNTNCMIKLAEFYLIRKKYKESMDFCNMALKINDQLARPYFIKGWVYEEKGDTANASTSYQTSVELDPNNYEGFIKLGVLSSKAKKPVALDYFNSAIAVRPKSADGYYYKAMYLQERGRIDDAMKVYGEILAVDSFYAHSYYNMGYIKLTLEDKPDSALTFFTKAITADPTYFEAFYNRAYCKELLGKKSLALADYQQCLVINPDFELAKEGMRRVQRK